LFPSLFCSWCGGMGGGRQTWSAGSEGRLTVTMSTSSGNLPLKQNYITVYELK